MRRLIVGLVLCLGAWAGPDAHACGDKFLVIGRGVRRIPRAAHPASILLYMNSGSQLPAAARDLKLEASLKQAGHSVAVAESPAGLKEQLGTGRFDLVIADLADARAIHAAGARPLVVPVAYHPTSAQLVQGRDEFGRVVEAPQKGVAFLGVIDEAAKQAVPRR
jgi:hypothetical protein